MSVCKHPYRFALGQLVRMVHLPGTDAARLRPYYGRSGLITARRGYRPANGEPVSSYYVRFGEERKVNLIDESWLELVEGQEFRLRGGSRNVSANDE